MNNRYLFLSVSGWFFFQKCQNINNIGKYLLSAITAILISDINIDPNYCIGASLYLS